MRNPRPVITNCGAGVYPSALPHRYLYIPFQRREYSDGLIMQLEESPRGKVTAVVWDRYRGMTGGKFAKVILSPSDIGALVRLFRNGKRDWTF